MTLIKKIDVEKHFAARRAKRLGTIRQLGQPGAARIVRASTAKNAPAPVQDGAREHSSPGVSSASIPIQSGSGGHLLLRPPGSRQR
jgi:hypothetical protein